MPHYLILFRGTDGRSLRQDPEAYHAHLDRLNAWMARLAPHGQVTGGDPLTTHGILLQRRGGVVTDGPFIESKEMVGGYIRFQADSLDAATAWARGCPIFEFEGGTVELREIGEG